LINLRVSNKLLVNLSIKINVINIAELGGVGLPPCFGLRNISHQQDLKYRTPESFYRRFYWVFPPSGW